MSIQERISQREWFHSIQIGEFITPGCCTPDDEAAFLKRVQFPDNLTGKSVLDIGTYDGFFAFEAEKRGASRVVAIDCNPIDCRCFGLAKELLRSKVEYHHMSVYNLDVAKLGGPFDVVLFFGVFYHLRYPLLALDQIWAATNPGGYVLVETHVIDEEFVMEDGAKVALSQIDPRLVRVPLYRFYRMNELNAPDYSNWFGGNIEAVKQGLLSAGFQPEALCSWKRGEANRAAFRAYRKEGRQEFRIQTYEGIDFDYAPDGTWRVNWYTHG